MSNSISIENKNGNKNKSQLLLKIAILSVSFVLMSGNVVSVAIPQMQEYFPDVSSTNIEALVTIPSLSVIIFVLLSGKLASMFGKKKVIFFGLICCAIGGIAPAFTSSFALMMIFRIILGAGLGSFNSIGVSIIGDFFSGKEQTKLVGYQNSVQNAGAAILTFTAGILVHHNWRFTFAVYLISIPILFFFAAVFPEKKEKALITEDKQKQSVTLSMILYAVCTFCILTFFVVVYTRSGFAIAEANLENQELLGTAMAFITVGGFLAGIVYGRIHALLKDYLPAVALVVTGISFFLLSQAPNMLAVGIFMTIVGFCVTLVIANIFNTLLKTVPKGSETLAISIAMVGTNGGSFLSPYILALVGNILGNTSALFSFVISSVVFIAMGGIFLVLALKSSSTAKEYPHLEEANETARKVS